MDREIKEKTLKKLLYRKWIKITSVLLVLILSFLLIKNLVTPTLKSERIRTAEVSFGPVVSTISASGTVIPEMEEVISCPYDTRLLKVLEEAGNQLNKSQSIMILDDLEIRNEIKTINDKIALKENGIEQLDIDRVLMIKDLESHISKLRLQIEFKSAVTSQQRVLYDMKAATEWDVRQAELNESISTIDLVQTEEQLIRQTASYDKQIEGLQIEKRLLNQQLSEALSQAEKATVKPGWNGVLTYINNEEGSSLRKGEIIARIANLNSFRIRCTASDLHASKISVGLPVLACTGHDTLNGTVSGIPPSIESGQVVFLVELEQKSHPSLRSQLRADIHIVIGYKENTLRLKKGPFINGNGEHRVFVVKGDNAYGTTAEFGMAGIKYYEIINGLNSGDEVIISSMRDYMHLQKIRIKH